MNFTIDHGLNRASFRMREDGGTDALFELDDGDRMIYSASRYQWRLSDYDMRMSFRLAMDRNQMFSTKTG